MGSIVVIQLYLKTLHEKMGKIRSIVVKQLYFKSLKERKSQLELRSLPIATAATGLARTRLLLLFV